MATINSVNDDDVADQTGARPPAAAAYHADASPSFFPPISSPFLPSHQHHPWQPELTELFDAIPELESNDVDDGSLFAMIRGLPDLPPPTAPAPFAQPEVIHAPPQMQPAMQMKHYNHQPAAMATQGGDRYFLPWQGCGTGTPVRAAPLAAVPDAPPPAQPAKRRGRPRGSTAASKSKLAVTAAAAAMPQQTTAAPRTDHPAATPGQERSIEPPAPTTLAITARHDAKPEECGDKKEEEATDAGFEAEEEEEEVEYADTSPPGVRFRPSDAELIGYLKLKYLGRKIPVNFIKELDVRKYHPSTVQEKCGNSVDGSWYVFSERERRYPRGNRPARSIQCDEKAAGYWKSNTKEADIIVDGKPIGKVNTLTFELGRQPKGKPTPWKMKEYRLPEYQKIPDGLLLLDKWVICKLFRKDQGIDGTANDQSDEAVESMGETNGGEDEDTIHTN